MFRSLVVPGVLLLLVTDVFAIGSQHGVFRSQSTQGAPWQGTAEITAERYVMTVYPDYLDVELEWTFTVGGAPPAQYRDALEIVGNLNLEANAVVVGMITWYKGMVLKGKLKTEEVARDQYENVVDRSSTRPPPPRDPVLLEYGWGEDNYDLSIFPVSFGGSRTVRIRYLIPAFYGTGTNKISYPNAFTPNATVCIRKGTGITGYVIEAGGDGVVPVTTADIQEIDTARYAFSWSRVGGRRTITAIVPQLAAGEVTASTMYCGAFSNESLAGEMVHLTTMSPEAVIAKADVAEDYVILWRWNHPEILARYARQIVEQSTLLTEFLASLSAANKRAAMIISREGKESTIFRLDKPGGREFKRMERYLERLARQTVTDPPMIAEKKKYSVPCDSSGAVREFEDALRRAMALFRKDAASLRHLLILTAGPQLVVTPSMSLSNVTSWDSTIDVGLLTAYMQNKKPDRVSSEEKAVQYWPYMDMAGFIDRYRAEWTVNATIGTGTDSTTIPVLDQRASGGRRSSWTTTTEAHLYGAGKLDRTIRWRIRLGGKNIADFTEIPAVVPMDDGQNYARCIGASRYLVPLAQKMPSSMASSLGFIDEKYSLVALEEDALPSDVAVAYGQQGVPTLERQDIFPAPDERPDVPVEEWLVAHPPQSLSRRVYPDFPVFADARIGILVVPDVIMMDMAVVVQRVEEADMNIPVRIGVPRVGVLYPPVAASYPDYSAVAESVLKPEHKAAVNVVKPFVRNGVLFVDLQSIGVADGEHVSVVLYDMAGRVAFRWNGKSRLSHQTLSFDCRHFAKGTFLLHVRGGTVKFSGRIVLR
jgi:hypothetical protein